MAGLACDTGFHVDRAQLTVNVALSDDDAHRGGSLLAIYDGRVQAVPRGEGGATVHPSGLQHAVSRMYGGTRYSLLLFFGRLCPWAPEHNLVRCDADWLRKLYADYGGEYNCNRCRHVHSMNTACACACVCACAYCMCICMGMGMGMCMGMGMGMLLPAGRSAVEECNL